MNVREASTVLVPETLVPAHSTVDLQFEAYDWTADEHGPINASYARYVGHGLTVVPAEGALDDSWQGLMWSAWVHAPYRVTLRIANVSARPIVAKPQRMRMTNNAGEGFTVYPPESAHLREGVTA